jgi:hypothetical protein
LDCDEALRRSHAVEETRDLGLEVLGAGYATRRASMGSLSAAKKKG